MSVTHNSSDIFLRPRFQINVNCTEEKLMCTFLENLKAAGFKVKSIGEHIFVDVAKSESNIGSPNLHLEFISNGVGKTIIKGLFGPKPQIWTLFMFIHAVLGVSFFGFSIKAYVDYTLGSFSVLSVVMLVCIPIVWFVLYLVGVMGKELGRPQMKIIQDLIINTVNSLET
ncbi:hypothetical protein N9901_02550 [Flavobacteriaceae bacterium]|nr:hypothetical protein [Flavobacteriaceae bacterium]